MAEQLLFNAHGNFFLLGRKEEGMAVGINGHRNTVFSNKIIEKAAITLEIFLPANRGGCRLFGPEVPFEIYVAGCGEAWEDDAF